MHYFHACVFLPYVELSGVVDVWEKKCNSMLVVEHPADGKTKRIHCHFLIETESGENWFRDEGKKILNEYMKRGNYWIATRVQKGEHAGKLIDRGLTLQYLVRKNYPVKFAKNFSEQEVEESRQSWVEPTIGNDETGKLSTERDIKKVMDLVLKEPDVAELVRVANCESTDEFLVRNSIAAQDTLLSVCRACAMRMMYFERGRVIPHASHYKIVAGSAYLRLCEKWGNFETGLYRLKNLWY